MFPLTFTQPELFKTLTNGKDVFIPFIILAFASGYIIHTVYRIIYNSLIVRKRWLITFLKKEFKETGYELDSWQTEYLYNYFIYTSDKKQIQFRVNNIRYHSRICSSLLTCLIATCFGLILFFIQYKSLDHFIISYYLIIAVILILGYIISFYWLNKKEIILTKFHFDEFQKSKIDEMIKNKI